MQVGQKMKFSENKNQWRKHKPHDGEVVTLLDEPFIYSEHKFVTVQTEQGEKFTVTQSELSII